VIIGRNVNVHGKDQGEGFVWKKLMCTFNLALCLVYYVPFTSVFALDFSGMHLYRNHSLCSLIQFMHRVWTKAAQFLILLAYYIAITIRELLMVL
jgi:hypothetical protein